MSSITAPRLNASLLLIPLLALAGCFANDCEEAATDVADLPAAVTDAIEAEWPGAALLTAEAEDDGWEVGIETTDGQRIDVEVSDDGVIGDYELDDEDEDEDEDECGQQDDDDGDSDDD